MAEFRQVDREIASRIADLPAAVGLRNVLVHGYAAVDNDVVWRTATADVPPLLADLRNLLATPE